MYCTNCGIRLPENARFCHSCGAKVVADTSFSELGTERQVEQLVEQMSPEMLEELARGLVDSLWAPIQDTLSHLENISRNGPVTDEDIEGAVKLFESEKNSKLVPPERNIIILTTFPFYIAKQAEFALRKRWFDKAIRGRTKKEILRQDFVSGYLVAEPMKVRMESLLKTVGQFEDEVIRYFLQFAGLVTWLSDECLKNLLLAMKLEGINISKDELHIALPLDADRSSRIVKYVSDVMRLVK